MVEAVARCMFRLFVGGMLGMPFILVFGYVGYFGTFNGARAIVLLTLAVVAWSCVPLAARFNGTDPETVREHAALIDAEKRVACDESMVLAINQYRNHEPLTQQCPACDGTICVTKTESDTTFSHNLVTTSCSCKLPLKISSHPTL